MSKLKTTISSPPFLKLLASTIVFLFFLYPVGDADLGWHLRLGDYFWNTQSILKDNQLSTLMPGYVWANHSWAYDILTSFLFNSFGFLGLSLTGAILIALSYYLSIRRYQTSILVPSLIITIFFCQYLLNLGLRSQLVSLLFSVYLWQTLLDFSHRHLRNNIWEIPLLFILWTNLHGQHIVGLGILVIYNLSAYAHRSSLKLSPSKLRHLLLINLLSLFAILVNPFGINLITTTIGHLNSPALPHISEWMPWSLSTPRMLLFIVYSLSFWWLLSQDRKSLKQTGLVYAILNLLALKARRLITLFVFISVPHYCSLLLKRIPPLACHLQKFTPAYLSILLIVTLLLVIPKRELINQSWTTYCQSNILCSEDLVTFLKDNHIQGKLLNSYRLGGYLIYRYPQEKVFIDGRMTLWQNSDGQLPFLNYLTMINGLSGGKEAFHQNNFDYVIVHPQYALSKILNYTENWPIIFDDNIVRVYQNPHKI